MTPALAQAMLLALIPWPQVRPRGRLQFVQGPGNQAATLQLPASRGQGRTWVTWGHAWTNERALLRVLTNRRRVLPVLGVQDAAQVVSVCREVSRSPVRPTH